MIKTVLRIFAWLFAIFIFTRILFIFNDIDQKKFSLFFHILSQQYGNLLIFLSFFGFISFVLNKFAVKTKKHFLIRELCAWMVVLTVIIIYFRILLLWIFIPLLLLHYFLNCQEAESLRKIFQTKILKYFIFFFFVFFDIYPELLLPRLTWIYAAFLTDKDPVISITGNIMAFLYRAVLFPILIIAGIFFLRAYPLEPGAVKLINKSCHGIHLANNKVYIAVIPEKTIHVFETTSPYKSVNKLEINETKRLQDFDISEDRNEIFHASRATHDLFIYDSESLKLKSLKTLPFELEGDYLTAYSRNDDSIFIVAENGELMQVRRSNFTAVSHFFLEAINNSIYLDDERDILYLSNSKGGEFGQLIKFSIPENKIIRREIYPHNVQDVIKWQAEDTIIIAFPEKAEIRLYDSKNFEYKDKISVMWGVRALAIDQEKELLFAGSFVVNEIMIIDLKKNQIAGSIKSPPWIRKMVADETNSVLFVTSNIGGAFAVPYQKFLGQ